MMIFVAIAVVLLTLLFLKNERNKKFKDIAKIPGPAVKGLLGNIGIFGTTPQETFQSQQRLVREYGPFVRIWLGSKLKILLADPDKLENILNSNVNITKSSGYDGFKPWLGNGLINSTGDHWRFHRKLITPTFHLKNLNQYIDYINSNLKILISTFKDRTEEKSLDVYPIITNYNLDVLSEAAMRTNIRAFDARKAEYIEAIHVFLLIHASRFFSTFKQYDFLFKFTRDYHVQKAHIQKLKYLTSSIIKLRKEERKKENVKTEENEFGIKNKSAFLDLLLDMGDLLTDEDIREEVETFMFAGHHTVSASSSFCLLELSKHPDIQKRLFEESTEILGANKDADLTVQNINDMKYLDVVLKEALRFYSPVPFIERDLHSDIEIDGLRIPKGTTVVMLIYALHRSEKYYPNPDKFDPDRFLPENSAGRHPYAYIPFSAGPRNCIGQKFALLATKALVIQMVRHFEILPAEPKFEPILGNVIVLESKNGICLQLKLRK